MFVSFGGVVCVVGFGIKLVVGEETTFEYFF